MEKDCRETFEAEFTPRGYAMARDDNGYYTSSTTDLAYRGWEAAWKYDEIRMRIFNGTPYYGTTYYFTPRDGFRFRIDEEGVCFHEPIPEENATNKSLASPDENQNGLSVKGGDL